MTPIDLLDALKGFVKEETKDLLLPVRVQRTSGERNLRVPNVYKMRLPSKNDETNQIPYVLLQFLKSTVKQEPGELPLCEAMVRIIGATYNEDGEEGALGVLNLLTRIQSGLLRDGVIAERYLIRSPVELIVYPDNTPPYYLGEMMTTWEIPVIESEVQKQWQ